MLPSLSILRSRTRSEHLLIMKLITSISLAFLLLVGFAASTTHTKAEGSSATPLAVSAMHDPHTEPVGIQPASDSLQASGTVVSSTGDHALLSTGLCLLGLLCGFVLALLIRTILRRRTLPDPLSRPIATTTLLFSTPRPRTSSLTLTQLGLSRT